MKGLKVLSLFLFTSAALAATPRDTLVIQRGLDVPTLDPSMAYDGASIELTDQMYETLYTYKGTSIKETEPLLATKYTISNGNKTYTFDLRKNVKFHSGAPFTCADAEYSMRRVIVTNTGDSGSFILAESLLGTQDNANDDKSVTWAKIENSVKCNAQGQLVFNLPKVDPAFIAKIAFSGNAIVEKAYSTKIGEWDGTEKTWKEWVNKLTPGSNLSKAPNGTGPYRLVRQDANTYMFTAFDGYWGQKPAIKNVIRQKVPELAARQQALLKGDTDFADGGGRNVDEAQIKGKPGIAWLDNLPNVGSYGINMNQNIKNPAVYGSGKLDGKGVPANFFSDVNVRRAFSYAFNYDQFARDVFKGKAVRRTMFLPDTFLGYDPKLPVYPYDPKKAEDAFKRAWGGQVWKNGFTINASFRASNPIQQTMFEILKKNIEALNPKFRINLVAKEWSQLLADSRAGKEGLTMSTWGPDFADPDNFLYTFFHSEGYIAPRLNWKDPTTDRLLVQARSTVNVAERTRLYSQIGRRLYDQAVFVILPMPVEYVAYRDNIQGYYYNPMASSVPWKVLSKK